MKMSSDDYEKIIANRVRQNKRPTKKVKIRCAHCKEVITGKIVISNLLKGKFCNDGCEADALKEIRNY